METSVFEYENYKPFISERLEHGEQRKFADYLGCQPAFLSQVLRTEPNLSLEQGVRATAYFKLNKAESDHFMSLLQYERAGSSDLQGYFLKQLEDQRKQHSKIANRVKKHPTIKAHIKETYYSSWKYSWVHVLTSIRTNSQMELLQEHTHLPEKQISEILNFLSKSKLIKKESGQWVPTANKIHVNDDEPQTPHHHRNFRLKALENIDKSEPNDLHFSSCIAFSEKSAQKLKNLILKMIEDSEEIIAPSKEETCRILCIDYFKA